jgi:hypothetical protein
MKNILLSKTFWVQIAALAMLLFPPVKLWFESNPVEYLSALAAVNVLLRFLTSGAVTILPGATTGPENRDCDDNTGISGRLLGWLLPAGLAGLFGFALPACIPVPAPGTMAISGEVITDGATFRYDPETGIGVIIDQRKTRPQVNGDK